MSKGLGECSMSLKRKTRLVHKFEAVTQDRIPMIKISMSGNLIRPLGSEQETYFILSRKAAYTCLEAIRVTEPQSVAKHDLSKGYHNQTERTTGSPK